MPTEFIFNGVPVTEEEFQSLAEKAQDWHITQAQTAMKAFNVSAETADAIVYLRSRSRWTETKEQELIDRDHAGNPIPMVVVLRGDF
jgi:hypothetical protein